MFFNGGDAMKLWKYVGSAALAALFLVWYMLQGIRQVFNAFLWPDSVEHERRLAEVEDDFEANDKIRARLHAQRKTNTLDTEQS